MPVTLNDLPKDFLARMLEDAFKTLGIPLPEKEMAEAVIIDRLTRGKKAANSYSKKSESIKKMRPGKARNKVIEQANSYAQTMERLFESAYKLAEEYGLKDKYFKGYKGNDHETE